MSDVASGHEWWIIVAVTSISPSSTRNNTTLPRSSESIFVSQERQGPLFADLSLADEVLFYLKGKDRSYLIIIHLRYLLFVNRNKRRKLSLFYIYIIYLLKKMKKPLLIIIIKGIKIRISPRNLSIIGIN